MNDDRAAIQAAINAASNAGGGDVVVPPGTYRVTLASNVTTAPGLRRVFTIYPRVKIRGASTQATVIRLADGQGNYGAIFSGATFGEDLSGFALENITIDQNANGNPVNSAADIALNNTDFALSSMRSAVWIASGFDVAIRGNVFRNLQAVWTVFVGGNADRVGRFHIVGNRFEQVGGGSLDFDASQIYVENNGQESEIADNSLISSNGGAAGSFGLRTAIEVHGSAISVRNNTVSGFSAGINVGGGWPSKRVSVSGNRILNAMSGVVLWADAVYTKTPVSVALQSIAVVGNNITLDVGGWQTSQGRNAIYSGVRVEQEGDKDKQITDVTIAGNTVKFLAVSGTDHLEGYRFSAGIHYNRAWFSSTNNLTINLIITGNTIADSPGMGIYLNAPVSGGEISGNTVRNPGSGAGSAAFDGWRSGLFLQNVLANLVIGANTFSGPNMAQPVFDISTRG